MNKVNTVLFSVLILLIIGLTISIALISLNPHPEDRFTEFYILNADGKAQDYPREIKAGQSATVIIGVVNHEGHPADYRVQILSNGAIINSIDTGTLLNEQKWEQNMALSLTNPGDNQKVEFFLFLKGEGNPHIKDPLILVINVINP